MKELLPGDLALILGCDGWAGRFRFLIGRECEVRTRRSDHWAEDSDGGRNIPDSHRVYVPDCETVAKDATWVIPRKALMPLQDDDQEFREEQKELEET